MDRLREALGAESDTSLDLRLTESPWNPDTRILVAFKGSEVRAVLSFSTTATLESA